MAYFEDLTDYVYLDRYRRPGTKNVGWLERGHPFEKAASSEDTLALLENFCTFSVAKTRGVHHCDLCVQKPSISDQRAGSAPFLSGAEMRVFGNDGVTYATPMLIHHYVRDHHYKPPDEFLLALRTGPRPPSLEYFDRLDAVDPDWSEQFAEQALQSYRLLAKANPAYLPYLAKVLTTLAYRFQITNQRKRAEHAFQEALQIYQDLAAADPRRLPNVAKTVNALGHIYRATRRPKDAETAHTSALTIYRDLAKGNKGYLFYVTSTLNYLSALYSATQRPKESAAAHKEDLEIRREMQKTKPPTPWH